MHDENGKIIDTKVVNEDKQSKPRTHRRPNIKLVYCKMFTGETPVRIFVIKVPKMQVYYVVLYYVL